MIRPANTLVRPLLSFCSHKSTFTRRMSDNTFLRVALCQMDVGADKSINIANAHSLLTQAKNSGNANLAVLPECWNSPYSTASFPVYAEPMPEVGGSIDVSISPSTAMLAQVAQDTGMWLIGGSIPERDHNDNLYNTCLVMNPDGHIVGKHRKMHLFDIDIPGKITFKESDSLTGGNDVTVFQSPWGVIGIGICYDIRFPELAMIMREKGASFLVYPGAFNMITGAAHWDLLQRARAVDNQVFVATCSPARDTSPDAGYVAWGHSSLYTPWGEQVCSASSGQEIVYADIDLNDTNAMREQIPCWKQKRTDLYTTVQSKL